MSDYGLAKAYGLLPSEVDRLTLYDIWCAQLGPMYDEALNKVKK